MALDQAGTFPIELRAAGQVSAGKSDDVSCGPKTLRAHKDGFWTKDIGAGGRSLSMENAAAAAPAAIMCMPSCGFFSRFPEINDLFVGHRLLEDIVGRIPAPIFHLAEIPGMTFAAGEVAPGLIDGKIVLRPGEVNGCNEPIPFAVFPFQGGLACKRMLLSCFYPAASGYKTLLF